MSPRAIEVHIEELVLHGFAPETRWQIGDALAQELRGILAAKGIPPAWLSSPDRIDAGLIGPLNLTKAGAAGEQIAGAAYRGGAK